MICAKCGTPGASGARFCSGCGGQLVAAACQGCGTPFAPGARFCNQCGRPAP
ncbi:zinc ribbon domain-containing protein [Acinetobacter baumannii]|nr:zinc ribbon domain-containing protein [Burkholderiaceae bacterium]